MREYYSQELNRLKDELYILGSMVNQALSNSVDAMKTHNLDKANRVIVGDRQINRKRFRIEEDCLILIATQAPMARDLRFLAGVLEIVSELERMGDYAKGIAQITFYIGNEPHIKTLEQIPQMCDMVTSMLRRSLDAFIHSDVQTARTIPAEDDKVDELYNRANRDLIDLIIADPRKIDQMNYLNWVTHNLERAADRVTNICERVIYTVTGDLVEIEGHDGGMAGVN